jgi:hypothetical protein
MYINRNFPIISDSNRFGNQLQAPGYRRLDENGVEEVYSGSLSYLEFIALVKKLWEESHPTIPVVPLGANKEIMYTYSDSNTTANKLDQVTSTPQVSSLNEFPAVIGYSLELRKTHTTEPKPRLRQNVMSNAVTIYGQKFQNIISFNVMSRVGTFQGPDSTSTRDDLDASVLCDQIIEAFEDFMLEYTPIFKAAGASELVYSRRLSDSEVNREAKDIHKRVVTYMLTTEKTYAIRNERINSIAIDVRTWMAYEKEFLNTLATPNYENISINIIDLNQGATPNT